MERCVFTGTKNACDINGIIPIIINDEEEADSADAATLFPSGDGKASKGTKSMNGERKSAPEKSGKKSEKNVGFGKGKADGKSGDKLEKSQSKSGKKSTEKSKGKGEKGGKNEKSGYYFHHSRQRHLEQIEYHQSQIEYFKELLKHTED